MKRLHPFLLLLVLAGTVFAQPALYSRAEEAWRAAPEDPDINIARLRWLPASHQFWTAEKGSVYLYNADDLQSKKLVLDSSRLKAAGLHGPVEDIVWSADRNRVLVYTNSARVWRGNTRGDYWYFDLSTGKGRKLGKGRPASSLMFAKFSPDGRRVAYVSSHNLYVEDLGGGTITALTKDGTDRIINGTFDWAYEEELSARDGFRWSPDGHHIAYWRIDATRIPNHLMINNTDSLYPFVIPVEYPKAGLRPSAAKIGVVNLASKKTVWMQVPGDPQNNYLPRMEWKNNTEITVQQLNRHQNEARLFACNPATGKASLMFTQRDKAWVDVVKPFVWDQPAWTWVEGGRSFLWSSEEDGWLHIYKLSADGIKKQLLTRGAYDAEIAAYDATSGTIYFIASPYDATQKYLYAVSLAGSDTVRVTPPQFEGSNYYRFSPDGRYAAHVNASISRDYNSRLVALKDHRKVYPAGQDVFRAPATNYTLEKIKITTAGNLSMDGLMAKPRNFDSSRKYPVFFYVYGEPAGTVADDLPYFNEHIAALIPEGYIGIALDNRGTPALKGREWRKSIYRKVGVLNTADQAAAAREIIRWPFIDSNRVAVFGWSGGGNMTLNLLFRYPELYKAGVAVAAVAHQRFYDNIYTERYMGLPEENREDYDQSSPITFAKNLQGHLLYMHGTGDDNVHYKNAEQLINELVRHGKLFSLMAYPNRSHGIYEGEGTSGHLMATFVQFIRQHCPPGAK